MSLPGLAQYHVSSDEEDVGNEQREARGEVQPSKSRRKALVEPPRSESTGKAAYVDDVQRVHKRYKYLDDLPPPARGVPSSNALNAVQRYAQMRNESGFDLADHIKNQKEFGNPEVNTGARKPVPYSGPSILLIVNRCVRIST